LKISKANASRLLLILIVFLIVTGVVFAIYSFRSNPVEDALSGARVINVLFVIEDEKKPLSTYVLMYYPGTRRIAVFDIPGELGFLISRINRVDRIDSIYDPARVGNYENEIEKLLGVDIDFSVVITKENLVSIVDLLEGIEIFIPAPVSYREDDKLILFPSGMTVLDGDKASLYATYSLPFEDRDVELFRRQRFFIGFLGRQMQMNENLKNPDTAKLYYSFFKSGINRRALALLFNEFVNIDTGSINIQSVGGNLREVSGQMLIIPLWDGNLVKEVVRQTLTSLTRNTEELLVKVHSKSIFRSYQCGIVNIGTGSHSFVDLFSVTESKRVIRYIIVMSAVGDFNAIHAAGRQDNA
jgi:anionic cell wall polymer biosynthesis LytR-Cps2A-Psr (LCP) family protein